MTKNQIEEYEKLSKLKDEYEDFIKGDGDIAIVHYSTCWHDFTYHKIKDEKFKEIVKNIAKERLENINKQIEKL
jgi:hypothetical protein